MKISVLIPAHNEGKGLRSCLKSIFLQTRPVDEVIIINDGSTDNTKEIIDSFAEQYSVLKGVHLTVNTGNKSKAQEKGVQYVTGDIVIMTDADTILDKLFVEKIEERFVKENDPSLVAVGGYVTSIRHNWLTACREIDYVIGQRIYKKAQSLIRYVYVMSGCATAIRTSTLKELVFHHDTVTEDLDFTFQIHLQDLRIYYEEAAIVYTQDPPNLSSYMRQMSRWYGGSWQNFKKYWKIIFIKPSAAFVISSLFFEGVVYSYLNLLIPIIYPKFFLTILLPFYILSAFLTTLFAVFHTKRLDLLLYFPHYIFLVFINSYITAKAFLLEIILKKKDLTWKKADRVSM